MAERIVITGRGVISPLGNDVGTFWDRLTAGVSGIRQVRGPETEGLPVRIAGVVSDFDPLAYMDAKTAHRSSRFVQFAVAAAHQAVVEAHLGPASVDPYRLAVVMNSGGGGMKDVGQGALDLAARGPGRLSPFLVPSLIPNMGACQVAIQLGARGPVVASYAACAAGLYAVIEAAQLLQSGEADIVVAGAAEAALMPLTFAGLGRMGALSRRNDDPEHACRPFDRDRDGFVFGEGAAAFVLERETQARQRGARPLAVVAGGARTSDAYHVAAPDPSGDAAARAMTGALRQAGCQPSDLDYICAHGTGTPLNDVAETRALKRALGPAAYHIPVSSPKSMVGHLLGAAGAISVLTVVQTLNCGVVPPTINLDHPDPLCDLDYVPGRSRVHAVHTAMANGFGFGGQNAVAVLTRT